MQQGQVGPRGIKRRFILQDPSIQLISLLVVERRFTPKALF